MVEKPRYIRNSFSVFFQRQPTIRRKANEIEDILKEQYAQPQIIPVPDGLDPEVPRIIFGSKRGFSQIIVSQINLALNVVYSPDWQEEISRGKGYMLERIPLLFKVLEVIEEAKPDFCGLMTQVRLSIKADKEAILGHITKLFLQDTDIKDLHDIQLKTTTIISGRFFSNITLRYYQAWKAEETQQGVLRLPDKEALERGIEIEGDFNDRYMFNEKRDYFSGEDLVEKIVDSGLAEVHKTIERLRG